MICRAIPYEGKEPYIFLSYCHKDAAVVYPLLEQMVRDGFRIWYDDGNHAGDDWLENIANHLNDCTTCLAMVSENSSVSHNCKSEINEALAWKKNLAVVVLEDFNMPLGMRLQLSTTHCLKRTDFPAKSMLLQKLYESPVLARCRGEAGSLPMKDIRDEQSEQESDSSEDRGRVQNYIREEQGGEDHVPVEPPEPEPHGHPGPKPLKKDDKADSQLAKKALTKFRIKHIGKSIRDSEEDQDSPEKQSDEIEKLNEEKRGEKPDPNENKQHQESSKGESGTDEDRETVFDGETVVDGEVDEDAPTVMDDAAVEGAVLVRMLTGQAYALSSALVRIGRSEKHCDIAIGDNEYLGGTHAEIIQFRGQYYLRDLNSANGTFINDSRLSPEEPVELNDKTVFLLHKEQFLFLHGEAARQIMDNEPLYYLVNTKSQGIRLIDEDPLYLDRGHRWEDGTLGDEKISRSGKHALIRREDGVLCLEDVGSRNGTYLNKFDIRGKGAQRLNGDDQIRLGDTVLKVGIIAL